MTTTTRSKMFGFVSVTIMVMIFSTVLLGSCSAATYKVGDFDGWTTKNDTYQSWSKHKQFHLGDSLVFEYDNSFNEVTQVFTASEYDSCDSSSPRSVYTSGQDVVALTEPGRYYFITSNYAQCISGHKLQVLVSHDPTNPIMMINKNLVCGGDYERWSVDQVKQKSGDIEFKLNPATQVLTRLNMITSGSQ
ncbi:unnamed protein product [Cochlearia groenlandica]